MLNGFVPLMQPSFIVSPSTRYASLFLQQKNKQDRSAP
ncbi:MAG: hypothetical protein ACI8XC_003300 [Gammaproteobacteria bacterium]|jgi:hypothetical protein